MIPNGQLRELSARDPQAQPEDLLRTLFSSLLEPQSPVDAQFVDATGKNVIGVVGIPFKAPVVAELLSDPGLHRFLEGLWREGRSVLIVGRAQPPAPPPRGEGRGTNSTPLGRGGFSPPFPMREADNGRYRRCFAHRRAGDFPEDVSVATTGLRHPIPTPVRMREGGPGGLGPSIHLYISGLHPEEITDIPASISERLVEIIAGVPGWAGFLDEKGNHVIDLKSPSPGPHFFTNLLIGNRIGHAKPLQTTPKGVVDRLGRGSFRSHADTQVLATRWDVRAEENGFPANRQFYLVEDGKQIFYSADPSDPRVVWAQTTHAPNHTIIQYRTTCGLEITRRIFLLPQEEGLPLATEVQSITVSNQGELDRRLKLVVTGMFGPAQAGALREDVLYTNLTLEGRVLRGEDGSVLAVSPHYHPFWAQEDVRFHSTVVHLRGGACYPMEFSTSYNEFVGNGTLENPEGLSQLSNRLSRKGPGFFALASELNLAAGESARVDNFTGLVSGRVDPDFDQESFRQQLLALLERYGREEEVDRALAKVVEFQEGYSRHLQIDSGDPRFDRYVNNNLPYQVFYQTFVSRSFDQTQKGHREIGAREIQDIFASMPFLLGSGQKQLVRDLLVEWASQLFELGYANHNFYWVGKQPGQFSDDALWLVQAVGRYLRQSGDLAFLDQRCDVAGTDPVRQRTIYEAIQAILRYSGQISIGKHGLPLLDRADWNDTLQLDRDYLNGPQKEDAYRRQLDERETGIRGDGDTGIRGDGETGNLPLPEGEGRGEGTRPNPLPPRWERELAQPFESKYSESVMNAFLLKVAYDEAREMAAAKGDTTYLASLEAVSDRLVENIQRHSWKGDFFARVLFNKYDDGRHSYLGAQGDGLSADPSLPGSYFLNSFTWSILANVATEEQIATMLDVVKRALWTPYGLKLCSPVDFSDIAGRGGSAEYFQGDRENGGVFKHADAMAAAAMFQAARTVRDPKLASDLADLAYQTLEVILPYQTMADPYRLCGNPRFCTQYNNSETGENIGPTLSGTATWLWLALVEAFGPRVGPEEIEVNPLLSSSQQHLRILLRTGRSNYEISISKPAGFRRTVDSRPRLVLDGRPVEGIRVPHFDDDKTHRLEVIFS